MDITYNYVPLFIDNDWSLVSIVPPNLNSQKKQHNLTTSLFSAIYDEFKTDKSIIDDKNLNSLNITDKNLNSLNITDTNLNSSNITDTNLNSSNITDINSNSSNITDINLNSSNITDINLNSSNNDITIAEIYDTENEKKSILDLGNLKSKNRYVDKKNLLLGFGN
jgi:uncharacterized protein YjbI with pentapeptide repeats